METVVTDKVDSHHTNPRYKCLLVNLLSLKEVRIVVDWRNRRIIKADLMPTEDFALELNALLLDISPTYAERLLEQAVAVRVPKRSDGPKRRIEKLEDVLT
jgi:hypothetical protein